MEIIILIIASIVLAETSLITVRQFGGIKKRGLYGAIFVDTSALIDGRIVSVAATGFFHETELVIPRSVIAELQLLADGSDSEKRARARHGLDVVSELQGFPGARVRIFSDGQTRDVDTRLLELAKRYKGAVCTIDYNLNKVAQVEKVKVLNINDLAKNLRMAFLPGEKVLIALTQKGQESSQAVGHLEDGTMVVVDQASSKIGTSVEIEVVRSLQTAAGRMVFAKLASSADTRSHAKTERQSRPKDSGRRPVDEGKGPQSNQRPPRKQAPRRVSSASSREDDLVRLANSQ